MIQPLLLYSGEMQVNVGLMFRRCRLLERYMSADSGSLNGMELSRLFYTEVAEPLIRQGFPEHVDRIAVGLVGEGSACFGYDDVVSRDHDWGPGFCIWLSKEDLPVVGQQLQELYEQLPWEFKGFRTLLSGPRVDFRLGVFETGMFYERLIGTSIQPIPDAQWLPIPEERLATAVNGEVFTDPAGEFTAYRTYLKQGYPEDVRMKKMAQYCFIAGQTGQYNYDRSLRRGEKTAAFLAKARFIEAAASIIYLLNHKYKPFYKWVHRGVKELQVLGAESHAIITALCADRSGVSQHQNWIDDVNLIEKLSSLIIREFREEGLSEIPSDFILDHGPIINSRITDPEIRDLPILLG